MHLVCGLAVRSASCRAVGHVHGPLNPRRLLGINRALYCAMMHRMLDAIVTISHYARGTLCGAARRRSVMVYNGGDLQAIHRHARSCPVDGNTLVLVGRLVDWKKQALAIRALHLLRDEFPDSTLEFLGGPVDAANAYCVELQALVDALGLTDRIRFRGEISPPYDPVAAATICVSCATMEAFGNAVLEAMALQTPVIVADRSAPAEFVRDGVTGLHYEADNPEALAAAIRRILRDPDLGRRLADAAWEDIRRPFDIDTHMERMRNVFSSVCDR
jgi:glycosyltransferase involved in cell wall biosynthesis